MSRPSARHRKSSRLSSARTSARHRKPSPIASALQHKPGQVAAAVAASALIASAWPAAAHLMEQTPRPAGLGLSDTFSSLAARAHLGKHARRPAGAGSRATAAEPRGSRSAHPPRAGRRRKHSQSPHTHQQAVALPFYQNPLRSITGLIPERIDMGADFGGTGPIYALGNAVITNATGSNAGWPGGGWITYQLTSGPEAGLMVFVAEDVTPTVQVGQHVTSSTVIATMFAGGDGIETGWAQPSGFSAESQLPEAGGISGNGPFPTSIGLNFEELLQSLGVPAGNNRDQAVYGILPPDYPAIQP